MATPNHEQPTTQRVIEACKDLLSLEDQEEIGALPYCEAVVLAACRIHDNYEDIVPYLQKVGVLLA
jgi:hypothetical protein